LSWRAQAEHASESRIPRERRIDNVTHSARTG
jgi:hypothetical protein